MEFTGFNDSEFDRYEMPREELERRKYNSANTHWIGTVVFNAEIGADGAPLVDEYGIHMMLCQFEDGTRNCIKPSELIRFIKNDCNESIGTGDTYLSLKYTGDNSVPLSHQVIHPEYVYKLKANCEGGTHATSRVINLYYDNYVLMEQCFYVDDYGYLQSNVEVASDVMVEAMRYLFE